MTAGGGRAERRKYCGGTGKCQMGRAEGGIHPARRCRPLKLLIDMEIMMPVL